MNILLIHQNFPGQFRDLLNIWLQAGHRVMGIGCKQQYQHELPKCSQFKYYSYANTGSKRSTQLKSLLDFLSQDVEWIPDLIIAHTAWGEASALRRFWPYAKVVIYPELWGSPESLGFGFDQQQPLVPPYNVVQSIRKQNFICSSVLKDADAVIVPSWSQYNSFPLSWRPKLRIIHEGVDCERFSTRQDIYITAPKGSPLESGDEIVTFCCREFEPLRGFHVFFEAAYKLLSARPILHIVVIGGMGTGYQSALIHPHGSKTSVEKTIRKASENKRIHFFGNVDYLTFCNLVMISRAHVYLSYPYTLSWSVLEAMASGAPVITNHDGPAADFIRDGENGYLVDFDDSSSIVDTVNQILDNPNLERTLRRHARITAYDSYSLTRAAKQYEELFNDLKTS